MLLGPNTYPIMKRYLISLLFAACGGTAPMLLPAQQQTVKPTAIGDTLTPRFSITTDSILKVFEGTRIVAVRCGTGHIFYRTWVGLTPIQADTINVPVCGVRVQPASVSNTSVCFIPTALADSLKIRGDTTIDLKNLPPGACLPTVNLPAPPAADTTKLPPPDTMKTLQSKVGQFAFAISEANFVDGQPIQYDASARSNFDGSASKQFPWYVEVQGATTVRIFALAELDFIEVGYGKSTAKYIDAITTETVVLVA